MKKPIDLQLAATLGGGLFFNFLFWQQQLALNLLLYSVFILVMLMADKQMVKSNKVYLIGGAHLLAALLVVFNQSNLTLISWCISLAVLIGFAHFQSLRNIFTVLIGAFLQLSTVPVNLVKKLNISRYNNISIRPLLKPIKYLVIPFVVLILFSILYSIASPLFAQYLEQFTNAIGTVIDNIYSFFFDNLSFLRLMHLVLGILLTAAILIGFKDKALELEEAKYSDNLLRQRKTKDYPSIGYEIIAVFAGNLLKRKMALKTENVIGILSFAALNLLLLFLNAIDIFTLWAGRDTGNSLSSELHEGTTALIISIVLAMLVIIYFFSGNLNFYSKNKAIRLLAYVWIVQNAFLVSSVLLRDLNYIVAQGLTYKRIGIIVFLLLCTIGLITVYIKVARQKSMFYLCRINGFIWYVLLLAFGFINWDIFIVKYNINNRGNIALDLDHLTSLSDKTLPLLIDNKQVLRKYLASSSYAYMKEADTTTMLNNRVKASGHNQIVFFENDLQKRIRHFKEAYHNHSWLSWNYSDWKTQQYLIKNRL